MKDLVIAARTNDDAKLKLLKSFDPLIKKSFNIYIKDFNYLEDALQEGYITILKCINNYDISSSCGFPGYVKMSIIRTIRDLSKKLRHEASLDDVINEDGGTLLDILKSDVNIEADRIKREEFSALHAALEALTEKQRNIIEAYYFRDETLESISKNRRCHYMTVAKLKSRAISILRRELHV